MTFGVVAAVAASSSASDNITPGVLGFLVVAAMGVALVFLLRSMNKQFRKIAPDPAPNPAPAPAPQGGPAAPDAGAAGREEKTGQEAAT